eukprot:PhF_6_TR38935/c0_g1_i1/m.58254
MSDALQKDIANKARVIVELNEEVNNLTQTLAETSKERQDYANSLQVAKSRITQLERDLKETTLDLNHADEEVELLKAEIHSLKNEIAIGQITRLWIEQHHRIVLDEFFIVASQRGNLIPLRNDLERAREHMTEMEKILTLQQGKLADLEFEDHRKTAKIEMLTFSSLKTRTILANQDLMIEWRDAKTDAILHQFEVMSSISNEISDIVNFKLRVAWEGERDLATKSVNMIHCLALEKESFDKKWKYFYDATVENESMNREFWEHLYYSAKKETTTVHRATTRALRHHSTLANIFSDRNDLLADCFEQKTWYVVDNVFRCSFAHAVKSARSIDFFSRMQQHTENVFSDSVDWMFSHTELIKHTMWDVPFFAMIFWASRYHMYHEFLWERDMIATYSVGEFLRNAGAHMSWKRTKYELFLQNELFSTRQQAITSPDVLYASRLTPSSPHTPNSNPGGLNNGGGHVPSAHSSPGVRYHPAVMYNPNIAGTRSPQRTFTLN